MSNKFPKIETYDPNIDYDIEIITSNYRKDNNPPPLSLIVDAARRGGVNELLISRLVSALDNVSKPLNVLRNNTNSLSQYQKVSDKKRTIISENETTRKRQKISKNSENPIKPAITTIVGDIDPNRAQILQQTIDTPPTALKDLPLVVNTPIVINTPSHEVRTALPLVLDLDLTLVHASADIRIPQTLEKVRADNTKSDRYNRMMKGLFSFPLNKKNGVVTMWCKIRPGVREFLKLVSKDFTLFAYTQGEETYAKHILKELDPSGNYFNHRLISRSDNEITTSPKSFAQLLRLVETHRLTSLPSSSRSSTLPTLSDLLRTVIILDDRDDVWVKSESVMINKSRISNSSISDLLNNSAKAIQSVGKRHQNLIKIAPYKFFHNASKTLFPSSNGAGKAPIQFIGTHECEWVKEEAYLLDLVSIMQRVGSLMWKNKDRLLVRGRYKEFPGVDAAVALETTRLETLRGCVIVFSGVIPLEISPPDSQYWKDAEQWGAKCVEHFTETVTHVVATRSGTQKVSRGLENPKIEVVHIEWLLQSILKWRKQRETSFKLI